MRYSFFKACWTLVFRCYRVFLPIKVFEKNGCFGTTVKQCCVWYEFRRGYAPCFKCPFFRNFLEIHCRVPLHKKIIFQKLSLFRRRVLVVFAVSSSSYHFQILSTSYLFHVINPGSRKCVTRKTYLVQKNEILNFSVIFYHDYVATWILL